MNPLENIINLQEKIQKAKVATSRLNDVLYLKTENQQLSQKFSQKDPEITLQNVSYQYQYPQNAIEKLNLKIPFGQKITVLGSSGSGKSTVAKLLVSFIKPQQGIIKINQTNIDTINPTLLRSMISYIPQESFLFEGTIRSNLTLGLSQEVTDQELIDVCQTVNIMEDINQMIFGFDTHISNTSGLSGGQKQRLAIARALLRQSPIIILDEATSALDLKTENSVIQNLMSIQDKTIIFIAHRLSVAKKTDCILVLDKGKIVEYGNHQELLSQKGVYSQLYTLNT
ncbi:hypothetical protein HMPREF9318_01356 [Streptococcus urinalis FB127-CNA-2]|uniref:ABC transporter, ATP-binding protein n=1 Tax=Streptococcus urinalis 2285-97 TaxID=764291 RepID=G5KCT6_9STRE|nr:ATP-binding cassette domain-containing protein [Streptococcus urinalis]EHJ57580.1 ABC transporter, ATP-binding protein [Streptococcus urinalis 2285-97]EKS19280.1 hypothetical protein HMPREF9318_01356 [Streptococcus urinalis FB127-CNA-2]VEF31411.1 bacteriocin ABC exporter (Pep2E family), ATP binding/membrane-spanning protein [Streptococcus urinalis]